jgi:hypothetical protein
VQDPEVGFETLDQGGVGVHLLSLRYALGLIPVVYDAQNTLDQVVIQL